jgi:hypothetical protein
MTELNTGVQVSSVILEALGPKDTVDLVEVIRLQKRKVARRDKALRGFRERVAISLLHILKRYVTANRELYDEHFSVRMPTIVTQLYLDKKHNAIIVKGELVFGWDKGDEVVYTIPILLLESPEEYTKYRNSYLDRVLVKERELISSRKEVRQAAELRLLKQLKLKYER